MRRHSIAALAALCGFASSAHATVTEAPYGVTRAGEAVSVFTLTNRRGMTVKVLSYGGVITEIRVPDRDGAAANVVLDLKDLAAYEAQPSFNALIGRFANRISGGGFTLDGVRYDLAGSNAQGISSHGGPRAFDTRVWQARILGGKDNGLELRLESPDGDNGYPGAVTVTALYTLSDDDNALRITYAATTDKPTVINLTHHAYFNLAGPQAASAYDHRLQVLADRFADTDARRVLTGRLPSVEGMPYDLRDGARIGDRVTSDHAQMVPARGFDHYFVLNKPRPDALAPGARLYDPSSGRLLEMLTTEPGVQIYSAGFFNGSMINSEGRPLVAGAGIALETQHYPDSPNRPEFPSTVLRPGETLRSATEFRFSAPKAPPAWAKD